MVWCSFAPDHYYPGTRDFDLPPSHSAYNVLNGSLSCIFWFSSEPLCKSSDVVNAVAKLSKAKHLLDVEDLPG